MIFIDAQGNEYTPNSWLTFNDVLLKPQRSKFRSRNDKDISLKTSITNNIVLDIPIISANMDTVTGVEMAIAISKLGGLGILHRFKDISSYIEDIKKVHRETGRVAFSIGCGSEWIDFVSKIILETDSTPTNPLLVCLDVAHGHMEQSIQTVEELDKLANISVIAGNIATVEGALDLADVGAETIKVGVGSGCFTSDNKVITKNGPKNIDQIEVGEEVLTHRNRYRKVVGKMVREEGQKLISINGIKSTDNHEYYVLHKKYKDIVNDENINEYAEWIRAKDLRSEYFLLKINEQ